MSTLHPARPRVLVVMATYNGAGFLAEQLDSIATQTVAHQLLVHDDASTDASLSILQGHTAPVPAQIRAHPKNRGFLQNFAAGIEDALGRGAEWIALSDQDDVWDDDRLERGLTLGLESQTRLGREHPILVHSDLRLIDQAGQPLGLSYFSHRGYQMDEQCNPARMLGQCGVMGNTILMNRALAELSLPFPAHLHMHDWWVALLAELFGTRRLVPSPTVSYRLHANNVSNTLAPPARVNPVKQLARPVSALLRQDFRLPYLEDSRARVIQWMLTEPARLPPLDARALVLLEGFMAYAEGKLPRWQRYGKLRELGLLPCPARARARVALAILTTRRYTRQTPT